jgi:7TMR-DISM extracellular protein 2
MSQPAPFAEILEDREKKWTIEEVDSPEFSSQFVKNRNSTLSLGYSPSAFWIRLNLENRLEDQEKFYLQVTTPFDFESIQT